MEIYWNKEKFFTQAKGSHPTGFVWDTNMMDAMSCENVL